MKKRVLLISYHFYPDRAVGAKRPTQLAKTLISEGWEVDVLTRQLDPKAKTEKVVSNKYGRIVPVYQHPGLINPTWRFLKRIKNGIKNPSETENRSETENKTDLESRAFRSKISSFRTVIFSLQSILSETKSWVALSLFYLFAFKLKGIKYDLVISSSPTDSAHFLALFAKKLFDSSWIVDIRDPLVLWDEVDTETITEFRKKFEEKMERKYCKDSDYITVTSPGLERELINKQLVSEESIKTIYNGYDGDFLEPEFSDSLSINFVFAGNLYFKRNPIPLFEAVRSLKSVGVLDSTSVRIDFFGDCGFWNGIDLKQWIEENEIDDIVNFNGFVEPQELESLLCRYQILLNFSQFQPKQIPAKTFDYLRYPGEMLVIAEPGSDTERLVTENQLGIVASPDVDSISAALEMIIKRGVDAEAKMEQVKIKRQEFAREKQNRIFKEIAVGLVS